ncbi:MAG: hypothetical protein WKF96_07605, partial [Solirubrobacteraceae bacterium]
MKTTMLVLAALTAIALLPSPALAATCADYTTQAEAQRAGDTRDSDGDRVLCEALPCPCLGAGSSSPLPPPPPPPPAVAAPSCTRRSTVQRLLFSSDKYPNIKAHTLAAIAKGWPRILVLNRPGGAQRRDRLLEESGLPPRADEDRDEYPPAVGRGRANGNQKGL